MMESVLMPIRRAHTQAIEEAITSWRDRPVSHGLMHVLRDLIAECLELPAEMRRLAASAWGMLVAGQVEDYQSFGESLRNLFEQGLRAMQRLQLWIQDVEQTGHAVEGARELDAALEAVQNLKDQLFRHWPWFSDEDIALARLEEERGELLDLDDAFAAIAGVDKESWLRRVEGRERGQDS